MGMYTQVRGWLNVNSIGSYDGSEHRSIWNKLHKLIDDYVESYSTPRGWVAKDTVAHLGGNGTTYIFFGTELKNYDNDAEEWIKYLIKNFPTSEGRIDFQYETEDWLDEDSKSKYWLIRGGQIIEEGYCKTWCNGYGNGH